MVDTIGSHQINVSQIDNIIIKHTKIVYPAKCNL